MQRRFGRLASSAALYLGIIAVGVVAAQYANYLWFEQPVFKGQATNIIVAYAAFGLAFLAWLRLGRRPPASGWLLAFLVAMSIAWLAHLLLYLAHGDAFNYTSFLYVPTLVLIGLKPPRAEEAWTAALAFAWAATAILVLTRVLEMAGLLAIKTQSSFVINFDEARYFLPLNDLLGIEGRWPGPFGHNGDTAMMGALLIVIAFARWSRASWVFIVVGAFTLLLTNGRASLGATVAGLVIIAMFVTQGPVARISRPWRIGAGGVVLAAGALVMYLRPAGLTGRENIWPAFVDLWRTSPIIGAGGSGISVSGGLTQQFGHAHSLYLDELARYGLVGFITQFAALVLGVVIACLAAGRGRPGALGVLVAYFVTGVTEPRNNWISPTTTGFLVILMVVTAAAELRSTTRTRPEPDEP